MKQPFLRHASLALLDGKALSRPSLNLDFLGGLFRPHWIRPDGGVSVSVHRLHAISSHAVLHELTELLLVSLFILVEEALHVLGDVSPEDVLLVDLGVVFGESPVAVRDVDAPVDGALERAEDLGAGGGAGEADVEVGAEGAVLSVDVLHAEILAVGLRLTLVDLVEAELSEDSPGDEQTGAVGGGVVRQPDLDAVFGEF